MEAKIKKFAVALLGVIASVNVFAQESSLYIEDFALEKDETKTLYIYLDNPVDVITSVQIDITFSGGITMASNKPKPLSRIPTEDGNYMPFGSWQNASTYRFGFFNVSQQEIIGTKGAILKFDVKTTDEYNGEQAYIKISNTRISGTDGRSIRLKEQTASATIPQNTTDLFDTKNEGTKVFVSELLKVITVINDKLGKKIAFATNGEDKWLKLVVPEGANIVEGATYTEGEIGGIMSDVATNPTLTLSNQNYAESTTQLSTEPESYDLLDGVELRPNEVISLTGFIFNDNGNYAISAGHGQQGTKRGTIISLNADYFTTPLNSLIEQQYKFTRVIVQKNSADDKAPSKVAVWPTTEDREKYADYTLYLVGDFEHSTIVTGVDDMNANKQVSSVRYYSISGAESNAPVDGINIVVTNYTDGTTSTTKLIK